MNDKSIRPTKKQSELLGYIQSFIDKHGYSPSYREIMEGLDYSSVATVALHVKNLIARGHLRKRDRSARSLEVVSVSGSHSKPDETAADNTDANWLVATVGGYLDHVEAIESRIEQKALDELYVLVASLRILGQHEAAAEFIPRLEALNNQ